MLDETKPYAPLIPDHIRQRVRDALDRDAGTAEWRRRQSERQQADQNRVERIARLRAQYRSGTAPRLALPELDESAATARHAVTPAPVSRQPGLHSDGASTSGLTRSLVRGDRRSLNQKTADPPQSPTRHSASRVSHSLVAWRPSVARFGMNPSVKLCDLLDQVLPALARRRPIFHSEADFQLALAWEIQTARPAAGVRLEKRLLHSPRINLDVLACRRPALWPRAEVHSGGDRSHGR